MIQNREHLGAPKVNRADPFAAAQVAKIEALRARKHISVGALERAAGMKRRGWSRIRAGLQAPQRETLQRISRALDRMTPQIPVPERLVAGIYRGALTLIAREHGLAIETIDATDFSVQRSHDAGWRLASRCRQLAIYIVAIEYEISGAVLGNIAGVSKMAVSKSLGTVEDWRDDEATDQLLERVRAIVAPELRA